ncbi:hypothetical protein ACS0TY_005708 [Phlomoides rotata]
MEEFSSNSVRDIRPPMNKYTPSMWGDIFSTFSSDDQMQETYAKSIEAGKKDVISMLMNTSSGNLIVLLDTIEHLGLAYHFETEMKQKLDEIYNLNQEFDLFTTALRFRFLRQHQYQVSCDVFDKFIGKDNKFEDIHSSDVEGLLSLYEASHVRVHGESVLEEAVAFTTEHLTRLEQEFQEPSVSKEKVKQALQQPLHKGVPIFNIRRYISTYERDESSNQLLLELAKINFNFLQNLYKTELSQLISWWNKFDLKSKLVYARDRIVECYHWGVAANFEPQYSHLRIAFAKSMKLASIIDDTYDNYATLAEAELFTQHLEREGKLLTVVDCYMKDRNVSKQEALEKFVELVEEGWKNVNTEWVMQTNRSAPKEIVKLLLNYARAADDTFKNSFDGYTSPENGVARQIVALYVDPILI